MEKMLTGKEIDKGVFGYTKALQDPAQIQGEINKKKGMIDRLSPHKLSGVKANTALKRAKELKEEIQKYMPSQKAYFQPLPSSKTPEHRRSDFEATVKQQMVFQSSHVQQMVSEYRNIMQRLDPQNPSVRNMELLRQGHRRTK